MLAKSLIILWFPCIQACYFENSDRSTIQMLHAISQNVSFVRGLYLSMNQLLFSPQEMESAYSDIPEALNNLEQLVSGITYQFDTDLKLPRLIEICQQLTN